MRITLQLEPARKTVRVGERLSALNARPVDVAEADMRQLGEPVVEAARPSACSINGVTWQATIIEPQHLAALEPRLQTETVALSPEAARTRDADGRTPPEAPARMVWAYDGFHRCSGALILEPRSASSRTGCGDVVPDQILPRDSPACTGLRDTLRHATAAAHRALEATALMGSVSAGVPSRETYVAYLLGHWRVHAGLEPALAARLPATWASGRLLKTTWLQDDLRALGQPLHAAPAPACAIGSQAQALGVMYVLEGATLGLSVVTRRLPPTHPAVAGAGRFMAAYGEQTGSRWTGFLRQLATVDRAEWPVACAAAQATFSTFQQVFEAAWPAHLGWRP